MNLCSELIRNRVMTRRMMFEAIVLSCSSLSLPFCMHDFSLRTEKVDEQSLVFVPTSMYQLVSAGIRTDAVVRCYVEWTKLLDRRGCDVEGVE